MTRTVKIWLIFTGVFLAGAVCGGFVSLRVAKMMVDRDRGPDRFMTSMLNRYSDRLQLTDEQREAIRPLIEEMIEQIRKARRDTAQSIQAIEAQIAAELTPQQIELLAEFQREQREKWNRLMEKREQELRGGPKAGDGGRPPGPAGGAKQGPPPSGGD